MIHFCLSAWISHFLPVSECWDGYSARLTDQTLYSPIYAKVMSLFFWQRNQRAIQSYQRIWSVSVILSSHPTFSSKLNPPQCFHATGNRSWRENKSLARMVTCCNESSEAGKNTLSLLLLKMLQLYVTTLTYKVTGIIFLMPTLNVRYWKLLFAQYHCRCLDHQVGSHWNRSIDLSKCHSEADLLLIKY